MQMLFCSLPELLHAQHCPDISMQEPDLDTVMSAFVATY